MATTTTRLGLRKPDPDPLTGDFVDAQADLNDNWDNIDGKIGLVVCTSGTRPGSPFTGMTIYETDTDCVLFYDGTSWLRLYAEGQDTQWPEPINVTRSVSNANLITGRATGDTQDRFHIQVDGVHRWGPGGSSSVDTNLYRSAADTLKTDDSFVVGGSATVTGALVHTGYRFLQRVIFTSGGTFDKTSYTGFKGCMVQVQAGGGAGGGAATTVASQGSSGIGGDAGAYASRFYPTASLANTTTVTVGAAGAGVSGGTGGNGGDSGFAASINPITCTGGGGNSPLTAAGTVNVTGPGAPPGGVATGGEININGQAGYPAMRLDTTTCTGGWGGSTPLGYGGRGGDSNAVGNAATGYGAGGGGARNGASQSARVGGDGAPGIVIIDVYIGA